MPKDSGPKNSPAVEAGQHPLTFIKNDPASSVAQALANSAAQVAKAGKKK